MLQYADLTQEEVCGRTLWLSVWDWNRYGRQQFLGEVRVPLGARDLTNSKDEWFQLQDSEVLCYKYYNITMFAVRIVCHIW